MNDCNDDNLYKSNMRIRELSHGSTYAMTMGAQYIAPGATPILYGPDSVYREIPVTAQRPKRARLDPQGLPCAEWWTINISGHTLFRRVTNGQQRLIGWSEITQSGVPASNALLRLRWDADDVIMNVGSGQRVSVLAPTITCSMLVPSLQAVENRNARGQPGVTTTDEDTTIIDTIMNVKVTCSDAPLGERFARLTTSYNTQGTDTDIPAITVPDFGGNGTTVGGIARDYRIPARARRVQFSVGTGQTFPIAANGPVFIADTFSRFQRGVVDLWNRNISPDVIIPGDAQLVNYTNAQYPVISATWTLEL